MSESRSLPFRRVLVANRGEVVVRVARTCRRIGVQTVAVAAPDDAGSLHARVADEVVPVAGYLDADALVTAARTAGADAVHPGWGFLAESPELAEAVAAAGLTWIGPPPVALRLAADKQEARQAAERAGVPTVASGDPSALGLPLVVKATAGGGGRGMRVVRSPEELDDAFAAARREARAAFGDDRVYCERLVENARHVEVQLLADGHGAVASLGERDCSVQRRHQKVLEETPSPGVGASRRAELEAAALALAREIGYEGAGTVELLVADEGFWFIELNARLQVEHPVTELVTGIDLVEQQLRIAAGERLSPPPPCRGHAVEARLYAEHPRTFLPQAGTLERLALPDGVRVDAGVEEGDSVPVAYDPLLAKLVAHAETREQALDRLADALDETRIAGVTTNLAFLRWLVDHPTVRAGQATTSFLAGHPPLSRPRTPGHAFAGWWRLVARDPPPPQAPPLPDASADAAGGALGEVVAPMPGVVVRVLVSPGARVEARQPLVVLEAMKMETPVTAAGAGVVRALRVTEGDRVAAGQVLLDLD